MSVKELYDFWTDYGPEDVEIMRKHGTTMALERASKAKAIMLWWIQPRRLWEWGRI